MGEQNTCSSSLYKGLGTDPHIPVMGIYSLGQSPSSQQGQMIGSEPRGRTGRCVQQYEESLIQNQRHLFFLLTLLDRCVSRAVGCCDIIWTEFVQLFPLHDFPALMYQCKCSRNFSNWDTVETCCWVSLHWSQINPYAFLWMWLINITNILTQSLWWSLSWACLQVGFGSRINQ